MSECRAYIQFCERFNLPTLPASGQTLSRYSAWLAITKRAKTGRVIRNFLSGVRTFHKLCGKTCPTPKSDGKLELTVRGLEKRLAKAPRRMFPITKEILSGLVKIPNNVQEMINLPNTTGTQYQTLFGPTIKFYVHTALYNLLFLSFLLDCDASKQNNLISIIRNTNLTIRH